MYDIRDVLRKGVTITEKKRQEYLKLQDNSGDVRMRILLGVFIKEINRDISHMNRLIETITDPIAESIEFDVFDKISSLVNQFTRTIVPIDIKERKALVNYILEQEKATYALLVDIQGRMVTSRSSISIAYYVLLELIDDKRAYIEELSKMAN